MFESVTSQDVITAHFVVNSVWVLFTSEELAERNCSGKKGKMPLDNVKLQ